MYRGIEFLCLEFCLIDTKSSRYSKKERKVNLKLKAKFDNKNYFAKFIYILLMIFIIMLCFMF